jgi:UDP-N-acetylmuramyl pentapeptide phosphotransferase/UDP-N-acetylglucosamine-1-phosphate transferase
MVERMVPALIVATLLSVAMSYLTIKMARIQIGTYGFQDQPNARSLHNEVVPKVGGLAFLPILVLGMATLLFLFWDHFNEAGSRFTDLTVLFGWIVPATIIFALCFVNDRTNSEVAPSLRLLGFLCSSVAFAIALYSSLSSALAQSQLAAYPPLVVCAVLVLSCLSFTNFFNFMDGIDGLAGMMGLIGFLSFGWATFPQWIELSRPSLAFFLGSACFIIGASCLGFLFWNWPKARVFMGDTGSTFLGFSAMAIGWIGIFTDIWSWAFPLLVFFPFWFDATVTLLRRLIKKEKIWKAHREHFYQRAVLSMIPDEMPKRHLKVLGVSSALMILSSITALALHFRWFAPHANDPAWAFGALFTVHTTAAAWAEFNYRMKHS